MARQIYNSILITASLTFSLAAVGCTSTSKKQELDKAAAEPDWGLASTLKLFSYKLTIH